MSEVDDWAPVAQAPADDWAPVAQAGTAAPAAPPAHDWSSVLNFFKALPRGALKGLSAAASTGGQAAQLEMGQPVDVPDPDQTAGILEKNVTGELPKPQGNAGRYGSAVGEVLGNPASWVGPGGPFAKLATGVGSAIGSEAGGDLMAKLKPGSPGAELAGKLGGAILGGSSPKITSRAITPNPTSETRTALVNTLRQEGIEPTAGQATGNKRLAYVESALSPDINEQQGEQLTRAALRRVGERADRATPEVVDGAFRRIGGDLDGVSARNTLHADRRMGQDLVDAYTNYANLVSQSNRAPIVANTIRDLHGAITGAGGGTLSGEAYQAMRSRLSTAARESKDPHLSHALSDMTEALDDAMARSIRRNNPADTGVFERARGQYRNLMVIERAAAGAGESAANGMITPAQLSSATKALHGKRAFVRGQGDFAGLSRAAQGVLSSLPDSGTSQRERVNAVIKGLGGAAGTLLGGGAGLTAGGFSGAGEGAVIGLLLGEHLAEPLIRGGAKKAIMNPVTQQWLANQVLPKVPGLFGTAPGQAITATDR